MMFLLEREPRRTAIATGEAIQELKRKAREDAGKPVGWSWSMGWLFGSVKTPEGRIVYTIRSIEKARR